MTDDAYATIREHAIRQCRRLPESALPYWLATTRDDEAGGYLVHDDLLRGPLRRMGHRALRGRRPPPSDDKQLVTQARLMWLFSLAHRRGYGRDREYLDAATSGYRFLLDHFRDRDRGGYCWMTDRHGQVVNEVKVFYGQAFVIFAFVELARAAGDREPLEHARALLGTVEHELHDDEHGGWREHAAGDWGVLADDDARIQVPFGGRKSGNAVVHWLEALAELCAETGDAVARGSLAEALDVSREHLFPADPARACEPWLPDWTPDPAGEQRVSYGHNVEYGWLMVRAQQVLGLEPDRDRLHAYLDHTLRCGFDHERGGAYTSGRGEEPADRRHKIAWVQCELIAALTDALTVRDDDRYARALAQTLDFVERHMTDPRDGILVESVQEDGNRDWPRKSGNWKAGYHETRAAVKLTDAFVP